MYRDNSTWHEYLSDAWSFSRIIGLAMGFITGVMAGPAAFIYIGAPVTVLVLLLLILARATVEGVQKCYRYLYDLDA